MRIQAPGRLSPFVDDKNARESSNRRGDVALVAIAIKGLTRAATTVYERESGKELRFVTPGPNVTEIKWQRCLELLEAVACVRIRRRLR